MEDEYQVLSYLQENETTTQRNISSRTGLSLGSVNLLLKKMVRKGLIKVERINARSMRYILTPRGLQEKARLTYLFIKSSYRRIIEINQALDNLIETYNVSRDGKGVLLNGPTDEICEIISRHLDDRAVSYRQCLVMHEKEKEAFLDGSLILTWRVEEEAKLGENIQVVNIMKVI